MKLIFLVMLLGICRMVSGQYTIAPYTIQKDSASHLTVFHSDISVKARIVGRSQSDTLDLISPDIRIANGIVDHKSLTGEMLVREYFTDSAMIGYIEYDGSYFLRERYFNTVGDVFLDKQYHKGVLISTNNTMYIAPKAVSRK